MISFLKGFSSPFRAFVFIIKHHLWYWYLVPMVLFLLLILGTTFSFTKWLEPFIRDIVENWFGKQNLSESKESGLYSILFQSVWFGAAWVFRLMLWYLLGRYLKYVILIVMSPLLAYISEKTETILTGETYSFQLWPILTDAARGVVITMRNLVIETILILSGLVCAFFLPALGIFITAALFVLNSYFMGFSFYDYYAERKRMGIRSSVRFMRQHKLRVTGLGLAFNLMSLIPFVDWVIAPINAAVGAVLSLPDVKNPVPNQAEFLDS